MLHATNCFRIRTKKCHFSFLFSADNPSCYVQTCNQFIMGRNLRYKEALQIIQDEEYLDAVQFDMILNRKKRKKRDFSSIQTSTKPIKSTPEVSVSVDKYEVSVSDAVNDINKFKDRITFDLLSVISILM